MFSISVIIILQSVFLTRPLVSEILFSNTVLFLSYLGFKVNPLVSILFTLVSYLSYTVFLTTSFLATSLSLLKSTGTCSNLLISNLWTSVFKQAKFDFNAKPEVSTGEIFLISAFVA